MPISIRARRVVFWGSVSGLLIAFSVVFYSDLLSPRGASRWADLWWAVFALAAAARSFVAASRRPPGRGRTAWTLLGLAASSWFAGMVYLIAGSLRDPEFSYYPTPASFLFIAFAPLVTAAVYFLRSGSPVSAVSRIRGVNLAMAASSALVMALIVLMEPLLGTHQPLLSVVVSILDPALYVTALLFTISCLLLWDLGDARRVVLLVGGAILLHAVADVLFFQRLLTDVESVGDGLTKTGLEALWLAAFAFQFGAAEESDARLAASDRAQAARRHAGQSLLESLFPAVLIVGMFVVGLVFRRHLSERWFLVAVPLIVVFAVALALREWWRHGYEVQLYRELREASALNSHLLAASPSVIVAGELGAGLQLGFASPNFAKLGLGEDVGAFLDALHAEDREDLMRRLLGADDEDEISLEVRLRQSDGGYRWCDLSMLVSQRGERREVVGAIADATERKRLEGHVLQAQRLEALGKLAGGVAHDFNNLLTTIQCYAELAREARGDDPSLRESLAAIQEAGNKGAALTRQLLSFSRQKPQQVEAVDLGAGVRRLLALIRRILGEDVELTFRTDDAPALVLADSGRLEQVVMNLVLNARDAMPGGGRLVVEVAATTIDGRDAEQALDIRPGEYVLLRVADSGEGMSEEVRARLFEPFFTTKPVGKGTGLGLATVHGIVRQHGGHIVVDSEPGAGSEFRVYLPRAQRMASSNSNSAA